MNHFHALIIGVASTTTLVPFVLALFVIMVNVLSRFRSTMNNSHINAAVLVVLFEEALKESEQQQEISLL